MALTLRHFDRIQIPVMCCECHIPLEHEDGVNLRGWFCPICDYSRRYSLYPPDTSPDRSVRFGEWY